MNERVALNSNTLSQQRIDLQKLQAEQLQKVEQIQDQFAAAQKKLTAIELEMVNVISQQIALLSTQDPSTAQDKVVSPGVSLILNPAAKTFLDGIYSLEKVLEALQAVGITPRVELTTPEIGARQLAEEAVQRGDRIVIAAGGDGTIEEVAITLIHTATTLAILPCGTMNNLSRGLGIPLDLPNAALLIATGIQRHMDVGRVITPDNSFKGYFLETAGMGISAVAAPLGEDAEKGRWIDAFSRLSVFFAFESVSMKINYDQEEVSQQVHSHLVTITNSPFFGNNMLIAPDAKSDDGLLDVAVYDGMELLDLTRYFFGISKGGRVDEPRVRYHRAQRVRITADAPLAINADLDVLPEKNVWEIEVVPRALTVIVGNGPGLNLPATVTPALFSPPAAPLEPNVKTDE